MFTKLGRTATIALGFIALGFLFIAVAWNGAAGKDFVQGQIPYLISGAAGGLGFIALGAGLLLFESGRRARGQLEAKIDVLIDAVRSSSTAATVDPELTVKPRTKAEIALNGSVVVGRSSYHRPDCRLVEGKDGLDYAPAAEAVARGLTPCRVCDPTHVGR